MELIHLLNLDFNFSSFVKLLFIFLLVIAHIIFFVNEYRKPEDLQIQNKYLGSGFFVDGSIIKKLTGFSVAVVGLISGLITIKDKLKNRDDVKESIKTIEELNKKINELKKEAEAYNTDNALIAEKATKIYSSLKDCQANLDLMLKNLREKLELCKESSDSNANSKIIEELNERNLNSADRFSTSIQEAANESKKIVDLINNSPPSGEQSSFFPSPSPKGEGCDIIHIFENYEEYHRIFISLLLLNYIKISCCISIIFIIYGNYLISKFNIETKYPKFYKVLALRIKYQKYYLILNFSFIFIICLTEITALLILLF